MAWHRHLFHITGAAFSLALTLCVGLLLCAMLALGLWVDSEQSLAQTLHVASTLMPAGQTLESSEVSGAIKRGGHIGQLRWQRGGLLIEVRGLDLAWNWRALLDGELQLRTLHAAALRVEDHAAATSAPLKELLLPLRVDLPFVLDHLDYDGAIQLQIEALSGHYRFDGKAHSLQNGGLRMASGSYQVQAELQAQQPMALSLRASGSVQAPIAMKEQPLALQAQAKLQGRLSGPDAALDLALELQPGGPGRTGGASPLGAMQATLQVHLLPGQAQPLERLQGQWTELDLARLWPQAPHTLLSGQAQVRPDGTGWNAKLQLQNSLSGPLDQQRLPLQTATASVLYRNGQWLLSALKAALAGGTAQASGSYAGSPALWQLSGQVHGIHPAAVDSRLAGAALDGQLSAKQTEQGIAFETHLNAVAGNAPVQQLMAQGLWNAPMLQLDKLLLEGRDAHIAGHVQIDTHSLGGSGQLQASLPGAQLSLDGKAGADVGLGNASIQLSDAAALLTWLRGLPLVAAAIPAVDAHGSAEVVLNWNGGWHRLGTDLHLQASLSSKQLDINKQHLTDLQLDVTGTLQSLALQLRGKAALGAQRLAWNAMAHAGQTGPGQWHGRLESAQVQLHGDPQAQPWSLQLQQPVDLDWQQAALLRSAKVAAGGLRLQGPVAGTVLLQWQEQRWSQLTGSAARWSSKGQLQGLPVAWLEFLGQTQLANLGLRGDLVFGGQWDAGMGDARGLHIDAGLQRSSGDLRMLSVDPASATLAAGLRDAHLRLQVQQEAVQASLVWASDAGGNVQADFSTRLQNMDGSPVWAADAPLQAKLHASLPRVGVWSLVAPVGWRMHGTLDADASLSGSRGSPVWKGTLEAHDLALRSVVDGIDFSRGVMRLQFDGQHMEIAEFALQGAGGAAGVGGKLAVSGSADWLPGAPQAPLVSRLRMALDAKAQGFRVSARADQRLVLSGNLIARLVDARLTLRGALVADQALFVLPDDTAPKLGDDVVVRQAKPGPAAKAVTAPRLVQTVIPDLNITLDPGANFQLQGHGISTRLAGLLTLKAEGRDAPPRLTGELRTVNGTYRAYGQRLNIEEGTLRFSGAYDNPALDIRALRPNLTQVVGVQVGGTAQLPVVRLYSDPDLPDADKLSWLLLGRASSNAGAEAAMLQQAALALLSGKGARPMDGLYNALGLDEVSLGQTATTNLDGSSSTEATVKLGKRISRDFYVAYERSLAGAMGTFYVFYDLSKRFTLRGESGAQSAVDLIFTTRYD